MAEFRSLVLLALLIPVTPPLSAQTVPALVATRDLNIRAAAADLTLVGEMMVTRSGEIIVSQPDERLLRTFSPNGAPGRFGRLGEGPGEFRNLRLAGLLGDSVWTSDPALERITIFSPDHKFVRSFRYPTTVVDAGPPRSSTPVGELAAPWGIFPDGTINFHVSPTTKPRPRWSTAADTDQIVFLRVTEAGLLRARIGSGPKQSLCMVRFPDFSAFRIPYCAEPVSTMYHASAELAEVTTVNRVTPNSSYHITVHDGDGRVRVSREVAIAPVTIVRADRDSVDRKWRAMVKQDPKWLAAYEKLEWPKTYPPARAILIGRDGSVWVDEQRTASGHHWLVLDRSGNPIGTVTLPEAVTVRVADLGAMWGLETDADGLQGIVRYRLSAPQR